jgi:myo-inositol-1(or 4)-monophosphatase
MSASSSPINLVSCDHAMLATAIAAAEAGAAKLTQYFQKAVSVEKKGIANFVSEADLAAESAIVATIRSQFVGHAIISEESHSDRADAADLWIIDPLDGTSNFLHSIPHFAVSLAYYRDGQPELGIVCNPVRNDWYVVVRGQGAWYNGQRQTVNASNQLDQAMIACGFYYDRGLMMQLTLDTIGDFFRQQVHGVRRFGAAALDLCNLGCGQYGVFFEYQLHPWDYAAGQLFVSEAGGRTTDCNNGPLPLGRPSSICSTNGVLHEPALRVIAPHWRQLDGPK